VNNYDPSAAQVTGDTRRVPSSAPTASLLADVVAATRDEMAATWWRSTRTGGADGSSERGRRIPNSVVANARSLVGSLAAAKRGGLRWRDDVTSAGWTFGVLAHGRRVPLYFVLEDIDLLASTVIERTRALLVAGEMADAGGESALALARRVHDATSLLRLAAVKGYTQSVSDELRRRFRTLRHDLRNPLGTIKSALALMEDETIPAEMRANPRFRVLAKKNASSMEALIRTTLGDSAALLPAFAHEPVSLRSVAAAVRRDFREEAEARQVRIVVGDRLPTARIDSAGFELTLKSVVAAMMRDLDTPADIVIDLGQIADGMASVRVVVLTPGDDARPLSFEDLSVARDIAARSGGRVVTQGPGRQVCVDVPISAGEQANDVGGASERQHR
jgi:signal transduction histidine kinase